MAGVDFHLLACSFACSLAPGTKSLEFVVKLFKAFFLDETAPRADADAIL